MIITRKFYVTQWDKSLKQKIIVFWRERGITLSEDDNGYSLTGKRGSLFGNLTAYDMSRIITKLTVKIEDDRIICDFDINTIFQHITDSNRKFWMLELETFESIMVNNEGQEDKWKEYKKSSRISNLKWTISMIILGFAAMFAVNLIIEILHR